MCKPWRLASVASCAIVGILVAAELDCDSPSIDELHKPDRHDAEALGCSWDVEAIPRVKQEDLSVEAFVRTYLRPGRPVVIEMGKTPLGPDIPTPWQWNDIVNLCFDNAEIPVARAEPEKNREGDDGAQWAGLEFEPTWPLKDFLLELRKEELAANSSRSIDDNPMYGFDFSVAYECTKLFDSIHIPKYFSHCALQRHYVHARDDSELLPMVERPFQWPSLMAGQRGSRSELHYDQAGLPFWMAILRGHKLFRVLPMMENIHLTSDTSADAPWPTHETAATNQFSGNILDEYIGPNGGYSFSGLPNLPFNATTRHELTVGPDFPRFPRVCQAKVRQAFVGPGDLVFIPPGAPHGALNLDSTVALTSNFLNPTDDWASRAWFERKCQRDMPDGIDTPSHVCNEILDHQPPPFAQRGPSTFYEMAGFASRADWCSFKVKNLDGADARVAQNLRRFCRD